MRKKEKRQWEQDRRVIQVGKWKASRRSPRPGPSCMTNRSQLGKHAVAGVAPDTFVQPVRSLHIFKCFTWEVWRGSGVASLGVSQRLLRDDLVGPPSYPLKTLVGRDGSRECGRVAGYTCISPHP